MFNKLALPTSNLIQSQSFTAVKKELIRQDNETKPEEKIRIQGSNQFQLSLNISDSEKKVLGTEDVVYFKIDLQSHLTKSDWAVYHRYSEFYDLNVIFNKYYVHPPQLTLNQQVKFNNAKDTLQYQIILNTFLLEVISRPDLITSIYTIKFLQLDNHYRDISLYQPYPLYHLKDELSLPIKCAYLYEETNLLVLALGDSSASLLSTSFPVLNPLTNVLSKISSNWSFGFKSSSSSSSSSSTQYAGQLVIYNILKDHRGLNHFEPLYSKGLHSIPCSLNYFKEKNNLFIGMENGDIVVFKIYITESSSESKELAEELNTFKIHKNPIIGCHVNFQRGYVYSFSRGKHMKISELNTQSLMKDIPITARDVIIMKYDPIWGRVLLTDDSGSLYIIDVSSDPLNPQVVSTIINNQINVTMLKTYFTDEFFILGTKLGKCLFFKIRNYNQNIIKQEHMPCTSQIDIIKVKEINLKSCIGIKDIVINKKSEVFIALENGSIAVYVHEDDNPEFVIDAHLSSICYMIWIEEKKVMISCSEDKTVKMLQMPLLWPSEHMRSNNGINQLKAFDIKRDVKSQNNFPLPMASSTSMSTNTTSNNISIDGNNNQSQIKKNPFYVEKGNNKKDMNNTNANSTNYFTSSFGNSSNKENTMPDTNTAAAKFTGNIDLRKTIENKTESIFPISNRSSSILGNQSVFITTKKAISTREKWSEDLDGWAL